MSRIQDLLKRILNIDDIERRIKELESNAPIEGKIGTTYQNTPSGNSTSTSANGTGSSVGNNGNGVASGEGDSSASEAQQRDGDDVFSNPKLGDRLDQLTGIYDCETGDELALSPNGLYNLPEGWTDPDSPPVDPEFQLGYFWETAGVPGDPAATRAATPTESARIAESILQAAAPDAHISYEDKTITSTDGSGNANAYDANFNRDAEEGGPFHLTVARGECTDTVDYCPSTAPTIPWPDGEPAQLAWKNGKWKPNENQTDVPNKYKDGLQSTIDFCYDDGEEVNHGTFQPSKDGGLLLYKTNDGGDPEGLAQHYNASGVLDYFVNSEDVSTFRQD